MDNSFENLKFTSDLPVFVQVINHIKRKIIAGELVTGQELPSRRKLAVQLSINPNTVQKIYKQLEDDGFIENSQGAKSVLCIDDAKINELKKEFVEDKMKKTLEILKQSGVSFQEVIAMTTKLWGE